MNLRNAVRKIVIGLSLTAVAATTAVGSASPASAAGGSANDVRACFSWNTGAAYANQQVFLLRHDGSKWVRTGRSGRTNSNGCITFVDVASHRWYVAQAYFTYSPNGGWSHYYYNGYSNVGWNGYAQDALLNLGRGTVHGPYCLSGC